jgi:23S rRNA pseudouridine2605 synthase
MKSLDIRYSAPGCLPLQLLLENSKSTHMKKRTDNFDKFANHKKGSAIKEEYRQQKKKLKQQARDAGEEMRQKKLDKLRGVKNEESPKDKKESAKYEARGTKGKFGKDDRKFEKRDGNKPYAKSAHSKPATDKPGTRKPTTTNSEQTTDHKLQTTDANGTMPLNKFIAHSGICGRREAAELVKEGKVAVNGDKVFEPGYKVSGKDKVFVKGKQVFIQKNAVYILLNKPKDFITTSNDPQGRKTVMELVKQATKERVYPVGRLDRNTTGVLLLTNDGELAQQLTHPSFEVKKIYEVTLDKPVAKKDLDAILTGVVLEDGFVQADAAGYAEGGNKMVVGIEIHSGRNRIVRRIFEHLGYDVRGLDRVMFGNLTKKNVDRGKWRLLNEKEVRLLKFMNKSFVRKQKPTTLPKTDIS